MRNLAFMAVLPSLVLAATWAGTPAYAHAFLDRAEPRVGSSVSSAPRQISLWFTQNLEPAFSGAEVRDSAGARVEKQWRWPMLATAAALLAWGTPRLSVFTAEAFPTSFFVSPTGYSTHSIAAGRALFAEHCASCHGAQGRGDGPAAKNLEPPPADLAAEHIYGHSDGDLFWWIIHGIGEAMPFGAVLDETAHWNLIDFLHAN